MAVSMRPKFPLGCDADIEEIFDFAYIVDDNTVSYIQKHGRIMFIIRGPPGTGKATLSDMVLQKYPAAAHCCADHYFSKFFDKVERTRERIKASHEFCQKKAQAACLQNQSPIIVQNTHVKKWEMQYYLDLAAINNYTVIMAITVYRYDCTPEALEKCNTDGLDLQYFQARMQNWHDVMPFFTGWFICPNDASYILSLVQDSLRSLLSDGKFCSTFDVYDTGDVLTLFKARKLLSCIAGYANTTRKMKNYYLSDTVQESYGKCFKIKIKGYLISSSEVIGVVDISNSMKTLVLRERTDDLAESWNRFRITNNLCEYSATIPFEKVAWNKAETAMLKHWKENEELNLHSDSFVLIAQKSDDVFNLSRSEKHLFDSLALINGSDSQVMELENGAYSYRLPNGEWFIKAPHKIVLKTIFTGLYL